MKQYSFFYDIPSGKVSQKQSCLIKDSSKLNFACRSFYNEEWNECYTFYRQGQVATIKKDSNEQPFFESMTKADLGDMYMAFEKALIVRSSSNFIIFRKLQVEEESDDYEGVRLVWRWKQIHVIKNMRGFCFFIHGNVRFQITTGEKIYFYIFKDKVTLIPELENVMYNFMGCS